MDQHKAQSIAVMAKRQVPVALVEPMTKEFVSDANYRNLNANDIHDVPDERVEECGVSMHLNDRVIDLDIDGPPDWQRAVSMSMQATIGEGAFQHAFKRESLDAPTHYLFSTDVADVVMQAMQVNSAFAVSRYQPIDQTIVSNIAVDFRTSIATPSNSTMHTVLPGAYYPRKDNPDEREQLVWLHPDATDSRLLECPNADTIRRVIHMAATCYLFGHFLDEGMMLGKNKMGRHSFYLTYLGWLRRLYHTHEDFMTFRTEEDLREYCDDMVKVLCEYSGDEEIGDRLHIVKSTFRADLDALPGNASFIETFRDLYTNSAKLMTDLGEILGAPPRPRELDMLFQSTAMDISWGEDLRFAQIGPDTRWNTPTRTITFMRKPKLEGMYNSYFVPMGDKQVPVAKVFQSSQEMRIVMDHEFNRHGDPGRYTSVGYDEVSKRQLVMLNTFLGHPYEGYDPAQMDPNHYMIKWLEGSAKLLTHTDDEGCGC